VDWTGVVDGSSGSDFCLLGKMPVLELEAAAGRRFAQRPQKSKTAALVCLSASLRITDH
jgi:hypothetical protein